MRVHMPTFPNADRGIPKGGSLPSTAASSGSASPLRRPSCNRKAAGDIRKRCRARGIGVSVHMHPVV